MQPEIEEAEEEDEVTEEDLRRAEEEFLHGPMGNTDLNPKMIQRERKKPNP